MDGSISGFLDNVKDGYADRFCKAFSSLGVEDTADLEELKNESVHEELLTELKAAGAKTIQLNRIVAAIKKAITPLHAGCGSEELETLQHQSLNTPPHSPQAPPAPPKQETAISEEDKQKSAETETVQSSASSNSLTLKIFFRTQDPAFLGKELIEADELLRYDDLVAAFQRLFPDVKDTSSVRFTSSGGEDGEDVTIIDNDGAVRKFVAHAVSISSPEICFLASPLKYELKISYFNRDPPDLRQMEFESEYFQLNSRVDLSDYFQQMFPEQDVDTSRICFKYIDRSGDSVTIRCNDDVQNYVASALESSPTLRFSAIPPQDAVRTPPQSPTQPNAPGSPASTSGATPCFSILWDIENLGLRCGDSVVNVHNAILGELRSRTYIDPKFPPGHIKAVFSTRYAMGYTAGNPKYEPIHKSRQMKEDFIDLGITLVDAGSKRDAADTKIKQLILQNIQNMGEGRQLYQVIISSDRDFGSEIRAARAHGAVVILFHEKNARPAFVSNANYSVQWEGVLEKSGSSTGPTSSSSSRQHSERDFSLKSASMSPNGLRHTPLRCGYRNSLLSRGHECEISVNNVWCMGRIERYNTNGTYDIVLYDKSKRRSFVHADQVYPALAPGDQCETEYKKKVCKVNIVSVQSVNKTQKLYDIECSEMTGRNCPRNSLRPFGSSRNHRRMSDRGECPFYYGTGCNRGDACTYAHFRNGEYAPRDDEINEYATRTLGMDPSEEPDLLYLARRGLKEPLPKHWEYAWNDKGQTYFRNSHDGQWSWEHPSDAAAVRLYENIKKERREIDYESLSAKELKDIARERKVDIRGCHYRADVIAAIIKALSNVQREAYVRFLSKQAVHSEVIQKDPQSAYVFLTKAINLNGSDHSLFLKRSEVALQLDKCTDRAVNDAKRYIELCPEFVDGHVALGNAYKANRQHANAVECFNKAGTMHFRKAEFKEAIVKYTMAIQISGSDKTLYSNRSAALLKLQNFVGAIDDAKRCTQIDPNYIKGYYRLGSAYFEKKEYVEAVAAFESGIEKASGGVSDDAYLNKLLESTIDCYFRLGSAHMDKKEYVDAIAAFESGLQKMPENDALLQGIAKARHELIQPPAEKLDGATNNLCWYKSSAVGEKPHRRLERASPRDTHIFVEVITGNEPKECEVEEYAKKLGMDLKSDKHLMWIAKKALKAPLPENWNACKTKEARSCMNIAGDIFYFNFATFESSWHHPCIEAARKEYDEEMRLQRLKEKIPIDYGNLEFEALKGILEERNIAYSDGMTTSEILKIIMSQLTLTERDVYADLLDQKDDEELSKLHPSEKEMFADVLKKRGADALNVGERAATRYAVENALTKAIVVNADADPSLYLTRSEAALMLESSKFKDRAIEDAKTFIKLCPDKTQGYIALGNALKSNGQFVDAAAAFKEAGDLHLTNDEPGEATKKYTMAINACDTDVLSYSKRSLAATHCNDFDGAIEDGNRCIAIKPDWPEGYGRLGSAYMKKSEFAKAIEAYTSGLERIPDDPGLLNDIADARHKLIRPPAGEAKGPNRMNDVKPPRRLIPLPSDSLVFEEIIDEGYEPSECEVEEYAKRLGMRDDSDQKALMCIANERLKAPLPKDWKPCKIKCTDDQNPEIYYFNFATYESTWNHPCDEKGRKIFKSYEQ